MAAKNYSSKKRKKEIKKLLSSMRNARSVFDENKIGYDTLDWKTRAKELKVERKAMMRFYDDYYRVRFRKTISLRGEDITFKIKSTGEYVIDQHENIWLKCRNPNTGSPHGVRLNNDLTINKKWLEEVGIEVVPQDEDDKGFTAQDYADFAAQAFWEEAREDGWYWNMD